MWTRDTFVDWPKMPHFCPEHWACLGVVLLLSIGLPSVCRSRLSAQASQRVASTLAWVPASGYFGWLLLAALYGALDPRRDLPLEFCTVAGVIAPLAVARRSQLLFDFFYYSAFSGVLGACLTPVFAPPFPHPRAFSFWALHGGVVVTAVFAVAVLGKRPTYRGIFTTLAALVGMLVIVVPVNQLGDANYMYLREQPADSILELVAHGPWYVPAVVTLGLGLFHLAYLPIALTTPRPAEHQPEAEELAPDHYRQPVDP